GIEATWTVRLSGTGRALHEITLTVDNMSTAVDVRAGKAQWILPLAENPSFAFPPTPLHKPKLEVLGHREVRFQQGWWSLRGRIWDVTLLQIYDRLNSDHDHFVLRHSFEEEPGVGIIDNGGLYRLQCSATIPSGTFTRFIVRPPKLGPFKYVA